ncbi:MAG: S8 family serine peptidase [Pirellulaceae bacterium]
MQNRQAKSRRQYSSKSADNSQRNRLRFNNSKFNYEVLEDRAMLAAYVPGELLIQFDKSADATLRANARAIVSGNLLEQIQTRAMSDSGRGILERVSLGRGISLELAMDQLNSMSGVRYAEPNWLYSTTAVSNDTNYLNGQLWGMYSDDSPAVVGPAGTTNQYGSQAEEAWNAGHIGSNDVYIGVIDEGIQFTHPDLADNVWSNPFDPIDGVDNDGNGRIDDSQGWDFFSNDRTVYDGTGDDHGTHVAGTIGAKGGNGIGVAGVNWNVKMISTKFLGPTGGSTTGAIQALDYLTDLKTRHGLNIIATNNSWGGGGFSQGLLDAITRAANQGILFVAAAGNSTSNNDVTGSYPSNYNTTAGAGYDAVIAVASITSTGAISSFSSYGATTVDLGAPGSSVNSTLPTNTYGSYSGTSMATPHVTGAIALYAASNPGSTASQLRTALLSNTTATSSLSGKTVTGGRLDISKMFTTGPALPSLSINDVTLAEGNSGPSTAIFTVTLSAASTSTVTVNFATADGTATNPSDYQSSSGTLTFLAGETTKTVSVTIQGDTAVEPNETFTVGLSAPTNATIADPSGSGTINNDDTAPVGTLSINNISGPENVTPLVFTVTLSSPSASNVTVNFATANGTAKGGGGSRADFRNTSGTLTFTPGQTTKTVSVVIVNDTRVEGDENFIVNLSSAVGAAISDSQGVGTITDDDQGNGGFLFDPNRRGNDHSFGDLFADDADNGPMNFDGKQESPANDSAISAPMAVNSVPSSKVDFRDSDDESIAKIVLDELVLAIDQDWDVI